MSGEKFDGGKLRMSLLPASALNEILSVLEFGAQKYAPDNWRKVDNLRERYFNAAHRHLSAWWSGERNDQDAKRQIGTQNGVTEGCRRQQEHQHRQCRLEKRSHQRCHRLRRAEEGCLVGAVFEHHHGTLSAGSRHRKAGLVVSRGPRRKRGVGAVS